MTKEEEIEIYQQYFKGEINEISSIKNGLHQKILLVSILDTLSRARFPNERRHKKRFISFIKEYTNWPDKNRVGLYQLLLCLKSDRLVASGNLSKEVESRILRWQNGRLYHLNECDPEKSDIILFAENEREKKLVDDCEHVNLLYIYRNHLVHEFREPGYGMEMNDNKGSPFYHNMMHLDAQITWELVYPVKFFMDITNSSLDNLIIYLRGNDLVPNQLYGFGTIWNRT